MRIGFWALRAGSFFLRLVTVLSIFVRHHVLHALDADDRCPVHHECPPKAGARGSTRIAHLDPGIFNAQNSDGGPPQRGRVMRIVARAAIRFERMQMFSSPRAK
jgi:hypothetical protein